MLVKVPSFSATMAAGIRKTSVLMVLGSSFPLLTSGESRQKVAVSISNKSRTTSQSRCPSPSRMYPVSMPPTAGFCPITNIPLRKPSMIAMNMGNIE